jgi:hypothetical protein
LGAGFSLEPSSINGNLATARDIQHGAPGARAEADGLRVIEHRSMTFHRWIRRVPSFFGVLMLIGCGGRTNYIGASSGGTLSGSGSTVSSGGTAPFEDASTEDVEGSSPLEDASTEDVEGSSPPSAVTCAASPTTLVQPFWSQPQISAGHVGDIVVTGTHVYFTLNEPSSLWRVPIGGGQPTMLMSITGDEDAMIATSASIVLALSSQGMNAIVELPFAGGPVTTLAPAHGTVGSLVADATDIYFADDDGTESVPLVGGSVRTLTSQTGSLGLASSDVIIAVDGSGYAGTIFSIPKAGGALTTLSTLQPGPQFPMSCGNDLCWMTAYPCAGLPSGEMCVAGQGQGAIVRMPAGGAPVTLAQDQALYSPAQMIFDGNAFFVVSSEDTSPDGSLSKVPVAGGTPASVGRANSIAVLDGCLFVIDYLSGIYSVTGS